MSHAITTSPTTPLSTDARIPRPMNSWLIFRSEKVRELKQKDPDARVPQAVLSRIVSDLWKSESAEVKRMYERRAEKERADHEIKYPMYKHQSRTKTPRERKTPKPKGGSLKSPKRRSSYAASVSAASASSTSPTVPPLSSPAESTFSSSSEGYFTATPPTFNGWDNHTTLSSQSTGHDWVLDGPSTVERIDPSAYYQPPPPTSYPTYTLQPSYDNSYEAEAAFWHAEQQYQQPQTHNVEYSQYAVQQASPVFYSSSHFQPTPVYNVPSYAHGWSS